ncbi:DUF169 domain-containing protein [Peptostreptococcus faecalis]|uniref:DUF169 domain-containing protein n=1 Tax=Peptostreptococcus faecalis TaxID=2045015 RepID=UPI000C7C0B2C|nr:DUF169 domain-containing protein [Peptostreptococcus faecalis]
MYKELVKKIYSILDFEGSIVGIHLIESEEEYKKIEAISLKKTMNYCGMVKAATKGNSIKAKLEDFKCKSAPRVLGIDPEDKYNKKGELWCNLGIYKDSSISESVRSELMYYENDNAVGVYVAPIEKYNEIPDVILFFTSPYNSMRLIQGYTYNFGIAKNIQLVGNQAICYESTARVLSTKDINISMLCIGTRHRAGWKNENMCVGVYRDKFSKLVEGVYNTINPMESDENKRYIKEKLEEHGLDSSFILFDDNYYKKV